MIDRKRVDWDETGGRVELKGIEGEETLVKIYCIRKRIYFQQNGKQYICNL